MAIFAKLIMSLKPSVYIRTSHPLDDALFVLEFYGRISSLVTDKKTSVFSHSSKSQFYNDICLAIDSKAE